MDFINIIFLILAGINTIVYIYAFFRDLQIIQKEKFFQKWFNAGDKIVESIEDDYKSQEGKSKKSAYIVGLVIAFVLLVIFYFSIVYIPIYIGFKYNLITAIIAYLGLLIFSTSTRVIRYGKNEKFDARTMIIMLLVSFYRYQVIIIIMFGFKFNLNDIITIIYTSNFFLANTITILMPILFFSTIIITLYLYWISLKVNSKINKENSIRPRFSDFLLILVLSSFAGLVFLFEMNIDTSGNLAFDRLVNLVMVVLASILIPSLFAIYKKYEKPAVNKEDMEISKDEEKN